MQAAERNYKMYDKKLLAIVEVLTETISVECYRKVWSLDWLQKSQVFQKTTQTQWMTNKIVPHVARL